MPSPLRRDLRLSTAEGMAASVMVGVGETYLPVFVLAISGSELACGLASTVPLVIGAVAQLAAPWLMRSCGSYRRWVALCAVIQAGAFVPLLLAALAGRMPTPLVFALIAVYWATGLGGSGPWNAWMETLVPSRVRPRYFAWRSRIGQWGNALGFVGGGIALELADRWGIPLAMFALLFLAAAAARFTSARLLASQREPQPPRRVAAASLRSGLHLLAGGGNGRLLLYLLAAQAAMQIAGPYFNPYMLGELHFSSMLYVAVVTAAIVGKILFLPMIGRIAARVGTRRVLWACAIAVVPSSALWLVSSHWAYLIVLQIYSGVAWGTFDLAALLLFFETIPRQKRVEVLAVFNFANSAAIAGGSFLGAAVLMLLGGNAQAYAVLFVVSAFARVAAIVFLVRLPRRAAVARPIAVMPAPHYLRVTPARARIGAKTPSPKLALRASKATALSPGERPS